MKKRKLTTWIFIAMLAGIAVGWMCHELLPTPEAAKTVAGYISLFTDVFLRLIKMIIAPLVFSTLVAGIAHMGDAKAIGRIGAKTMGWFLTASLASLLIGLIMAHLLHPGQGLNLPLPDVSATSGLAKSLSLKDFLAHVFPTSIVQAMAENEILQIVVFSLFAGIALAAVEEKAHGLLHIIEQVAAVMLKVTDYVMKVAPLAVFCAVTATVATEG